MDQIKASAMNASNLAALKTLDDTKYLDSIEECYRYTGPNTFGTFYPAPPLPGRYYNENYQWPVVIAAGTIVSIVPYRGVVEYNATNYPSGVDSATGITNDGQIFVNIGVDGTARKMELNAVFHRGMSGFVVPANGGVATNDSYSNKDGEYGIMVASNATTCAAVTTGTTAYARAANKPIGVVNTAVYAWNPYRYMNYNVHQNGFGIQKDGVFTIPYVQIYGTPVASVTTIAAAVYAAIDKRLQFMFISNGHVDTLATALAAANAAIVPGTWTCSNLDGKFVPLASSGLTAQALEEQKFGKVLGIRNNIPYHMDEIIDTPLDSGITGTDTVGLSKRLYLFAKNVLSATGVFAAAPTRTSIASVIAAPVQTQAATVYVKVGMIDIAFGSMA